MTEEERPPAHPSTHQYWYPDSKEDSSAKRQDSGYEFNYPKDKYIDGYLIEKFNIVMNSFNKRQNRLHSLATLKISDKLQNLTQILS